MKWFRKKVVKCETDLEKFCSGIDSDVIAKQYDERDRLKLAVATTYLCFYLAQDFKDSICKFALLKSYSEKTNPDVILFEAVKFCHSTLYYWSDVTLTLRLPEIHVGHQ